MGIGEGAKLGAKAGAIGGLLFILIGAPLIYLLVGPAIREQLRSSAFDIPVDGFQALLLCLLIVAVIGFVLGEALAVSSGRSFLADEANAWRSGQDGGTAPAAGGWPGSSD